MNATELRRVADHRNALLIAAAQQVALEYLPKIEADITAAAQQGRYKISLHMPESFDTFTIRALTGSLMDKKLSVTPIPPGEKSSVWEMVIAW
jgi:hypothetical protein